MAEVTFAGRAYRIRPAGVLGPVERTRLLEAYARADAYRAIADPSALEVARYLELLRDVVRLALVGVSERALRQARRADLLEVVAAFERATLAGLDELLPLAPRTKTKYAEQLDPIRQKVASEVS